MNAIQMGIISSQISEAWVMVGFHSSGYLYSGNTGLSPALSNANVPFMIAYEDQITYSEIEVYSVAPHSSISFQTFTADGMILLVTISKTAYLDSLAVTIENIDVPGVDEYIYVNGIMAYQ